MTSVQKTVLIPGGDEVVLYGTIFGTIGALLPMPSRDDLHHLMHIEMYIRKQEPSLVGRDILSWRSAYTPMKVGRDEERAEGQGIIDGNLCETFSMLPQNKQEEIANALVLSVSSIVKKMEDLRSRVMWIVCWSRSIGKDANRSYLSHIIDVEFLLDVLLFRQT